MCWYELTMKACYELLLLLLFDVFPPRTRLKVDSEKDQECVAEERTIENREKSSRLPTFFAPILIIDRRSFMIFLDVLGFNTWRFHCLGFKICWVKCWKHNQTLCFNLLDFKMH